MRLLLFLLLTAAASASASPMISGVAFYNLKDRRQPPGDPIADSCPRTRITRLCARFTIMGTGETLAYLTEHGYLSVIIEWRVNGVVRDTLDIGISQDKWDLAEDDLRRQVTETGFFTYRTSSYRTYIPPGRYEVTIRDSSGNILSPSDFAGHGLYQPAIQVTP